MLKSPMMSGPKCPSCGDKKMVTDESTGELFCGKCGFVVTDKILDTGAEWRSFSNDEGNKARTGAGTSLTMHDMGLSTVIGAANKDSTGKPLSASVKSSIETSLKSKVAAAIDDRKQQVAAQVFNSDDDEEEHQDITEDKDYVDDDEEWDDSTYEFDDDDEYDLDEDDEWLEGEAIEDGG